VENTTLLTYVIFGWLGIVLIACTITDIRQKKIPNALTLTTIFAALLLHLSLNGWEGLMFSLQGLGLGFLFLLVPYSLGGIGAGDVKLTMAIGAVLGPINMLYIIVCIALAGGILTVSYMLHRRVVKKTLYRIWMFIVFALTQKDMSLLKYNKKEVLQEGIPFAMAISTGAFMYVGYTCLVVGEVAILHSVL